MIIGGFLGGAGSFFGAKSQSNAQNKIAARAERRAAALTKELEVLERSRQAVINPYEDVVSLDDMIVDNTGILSNPFENIGVATQAAKFQAEEADIALANTLDLLAATGASAGGATALAQAAIQSKRNVSKSLEQQEVQNDRLAAQGEQFLQQQQLSEAQRVQQAQMTEAQRIQQAEVLGEEFVYGEYERRETERMNRKQAQITGQQQVGITARQGAANIMASGVTAATNMITTGITSAAQYGFGNNTPGNTGAYNQFNPATFAPLPSTPLPSVGYQNPSFNPSTYF